MADTPKVYSLLNTGKRRFPLPKDAKSGKARVIEPGKSRSDITEAEYKQLSRYPDLVDPAKFMPGSGDLVAKLREENKALAGRVKELEAGSGGKELDSANARIAELEAELAEGKDAHQKLVEAHDKLQEKYQKLKDK